MMQATHVWYRVKGIDGMKTYLRVIGERDHGYQVMIVSFHEEYCRESVECISRHLFEACVRTGYLFPEDPPRRSVESETPQAPVAATG